MYNSIFTEIHEKQLQKFIGADLSQIDNYLYSLEKIFADVGETIIMMVNHEKKNDIYKKGNIKSFQHLLKEINEYPRVISSKKDKLFKQYLEKIVGMFK